jgi:hypothetical protein
MRNLTVLIGLKLLLICVTSNCMAQAATLSNTDYRPFQSPVRSLARAPQPAAYAVCDMMETFLGVPTQLDGVSAANEAQRQNSGSDIQFYQGWLETQGLLRLEPRASHTEKNYLHYVCPQGSVFAFPQSEGIRSPEKIVAWLQQGIKGIVVAYDYCSADWKTGHTALGEDKEKHRPHRSHAVLIVGHQDSSFIFKNVWGENWGEAGYGRMTFAYHRAHAAKGLVAFLAEAIEPMIGEIAALSLKVLPEILEGRPHLQLSLLGRGSGKLPQFDFLSYTLKSGNATPATTKNLLMGNARSTGYPSIIAVPDQNSTFDLTVHFRLAGSRETNNITLFALKWRNAEFPLPQ